MAVLPGSVEVHAQVGDQEPLRSAAVFGHRQLEDLLRLVGDPPREHALGFVRADGGDRPFGAREGKDRLALAEGVRQGNGLGRASDLAQLGELDFQLLDAVLADGRDLDHPALQRRHVADLQLAKIIGHVLHFPIGGLEPDRTQVDAAVVQPQGHVVAGGLEGRCGQCGVAFSQRVQGLQAAPVAQAEGLHPAIGHQRPAYGAVLVHAHAHRRRALPRGAGAGFLIHGGPLEEGKHHHNEEHRHDGDGDDGADPAHGDDTAGDGVHQPHAGGGGSGAGAAGEALLVAAAHGLETPW